MARVLVWSPEAINDIEAIAAYIERDSPWYAKAVVSKLVESAGSIAESQSSDAWFRNSETQAPENAWSTGIA